MGKKSRYTKEFLSEMVADSYNWSDLLRNLGLKVTGGNHRHIKGKGVVFKIDTSHFKKGSWNKGLTAETSEKVREHAKKTRMPDEEIFIDGSTYSSSRLYVRLIAMGWIPACAICSMSEWMDEPLRLHVDHINGVHTDCRIENLRFLCPNCHSQTKTYSGRNTRSGGNTPKKKKAKRQGRQCKGCDGNTSRNSKSGLCIKCFSITRRKTERPSKKILVQQVEDFGYRGTGRIYGVSDNSIRKWLKS